MDDPSTQGTDQQIMTTVVAADELAKPSFTVKKSGEVDRNETRSYFVEVPEGAKSLEVSLGGLFGKSQVRFISIHPYGVPVDSTSTPNCYNNYNNGNGCRPDLRSYADPAPGVWEIEVEARRTSPLLRNPYQLEVSLLGVAFDPAVQTVPEAKVGTPAPVEWKITNENAALEGKLKGGPLGSSLSKRPEIKNGEAQTSEITVGEGVERLDVRPDDTLTEQLKARVIIPVERQPVSLDPLALRGDNKRLKDGHGLHSGLGVVCPRHPFEDRGGWVGRVERLIEVQRGRLADDEVLEARPVEITQSLLIG